jgi:predicted amidohydrolase
MLAIFPECALTGYCFDDLEEARAGAIDRDGPELRRLREASRDLDLRVIVGYLERTGRSVANAVSAVGSRGVEAHYRKTHLPHLGADRFTEPGCDPFAVHDVAGLRLGMLICFDASFPEATRLLALAGADLVALPTNWPAEAMGKAAFLPNARAYENVIYFASVNRVGEERGYRFRGGSRICGVEGEVLAEGPLDAEAILVADVDPARARTKRIERRKGEYWLDRIAQRRVDLYRLEPAKGKTAER